MKKKIYELLRKYVARMATGKLGKVRILDDQIICYVDGRKIKKKEKYLHRYNLIFKCIPSKEEIYRIYKVDKPVHYIVKNVDFDMEVNISASMKDCHVTFENCTFTAAVEIDFADHLTFINNKYNVQNDKNFYSIYKKGEFCISTRTDKNEINKIEFINDDIDVEYLENIPVFKATDKLPKKKEEKNSNVSIWLYAREIAVINADINTKSIDIGTDKLLLNEVSLKSEDMEITAINFENYFTAIESDVISIETDEYAHLNENLKCKSIFLNGIEMNKNEPNIDMETLKLQNHRLELINTFKKIERTSEEVIREEIRKQPLTRVLKR